MKQLLHLLMAVICINTIAMASAQSEKPAEETNLPLKSKKGNMNFSEANPEDITNENFPNLIESFDYPNADISEVVTAISKLTGKRFIIDPGVRGKISIISPSQITVAEAYKAFLSALAMVKLTVVPSGKFLKIRPIREARQDSIETYAGNYFPNTDQLITRIVKLKYIDAEEVHKQLRLLTSKDGDITPYSPTNSLIMTDFGSNVERVMEIINQLDVPGFEERLVVIRIRHARAKDISDLLEQIISEGKGNSKSGRFGSGVPRFRSSTASTGSSGKGAASYSLVVPDGRTNSIIVVGNQAGIERIRKLVAKLDFKLRPEDAGGVYVYYLRHSESEKVANVLNGIASESSKSQSTSAKGSSAKSTAPAESQSAAVFGGDVKVTADKDNNSLIITASKQDFEVVKSILRKIDIPRDQVFVKAIVLEMNASKTVNWGINYYTFADGTNGVGRMGFRSSDNISSIIDPAGDRGAILGFGSGSNVTINIGGTEKEVPSLTGLINFIKSNNAGNVLSTPQIMALDNEEAELEVGDTVPVSTESNSTATGVSSGIKREDLTLKLKITPFISPDTDNVRLKIEQQIKQLSDRQVQADELAKSSVITSTRNIKTSIVVNSGDTAVLGGLMSDTETEEVTKVPVLGDIPILGWLFKGKRQQKFKNNLVVFITPKVIRNSQDGSDLLNEKLNERIDFIQQHMRGRDPHGGIIDNLPRKAYIETQTEEFVTQPINNVREGEPEQFNDESGISEEDLLEPPAESGGSR